MSNGTTPPQNISDIDFLRTRSLANVVQHEIERMIVDGELKPNERVNENALAQRLRVSRGPIREACSALAAMGLIEIVPNRGFFVRALSDEEALDLSEARAGVFGCMVMMAAERATDEDVATLRRLVDQMDAIVPTSEVSEYYPINLEFHAQLARTSNNKRLAQFYQSLVKELHIQRYRALASGNVLHVSNAEHRAILDAVAAHNPTAAFMAGRLHILNGIVRTSQARRSAPAAPPSVKSKPKSRGTRSAIQE